MTVKSLLVKFGVDFSEFNSGMDRMQANLEKHAKQFKSIGIGMAAVGGIMTAFFAKAIDEAAKSEAVQAKLEQALKRSGDASGEGAKKLEAYAKQLSLTTAYSDEEIMSAQALLATYGLTASQIAELTPRVLDLASAHSNETGEVIGLDGAARSLGMAVNGNTTTLQRHGVVLAADTKATGDFALVCRDLDKSVGGTAAAFGQTFSGQLKIARNQVGEVVESIGSKLLPLLLPLIQKVVTAAQAIGKWIDAHQGLMKILVPVAAAVGALLTVTGGVLMILPKVVNATMALGKALIWLATNPYALVIAAAAAFVIILLQVRDAEEQAEIATQRYNEVNAKYTAKLAEAAKQAGMTAAEFEKLTKKYEGNSAALGWAIQKGKEGKELQEALAKVSKEHGAAIDKLEAAQRKAAQSTVDLSAKQTELQDKLSKGRKEMLDDLVKLTTGEVEMTKRAANEEYQIRKKALDETRAANKKYNDDVVLLNQIRVLKISQAEEKQRMDEIKRMQEERNAAKAQADAILQIVFAQHGRMVEAETALAAQKARMRGQEHKALLIELAAERDAKLASIVSDISMSEEEKTRLLEIWRDYYEQKGIQIDNDAAAALAGFDAIMVGGTASIQTLTENTLGLLQAWGEGTKSLLGVAGEAFKMFAGLAMSAVSAAVSAELSGSVASINASRATAIGKIIASVMSLPFPLNLAVVGGAIAAVYALFHAIHFAEGGIVTKPTLALIGEAGPEAVVPLRGAGRSGMPAFAGAGIGGQFRITNNFYGDIRSDKDIEKISKAVADQITRASKHRRL